MKIPYQLVPAVKVEQRYANMAHAIARGLPRLQQVPIDEHPDHVLHVACFGPSLADTWQDLRHPILSMSGATKWLAERGVIADYHVDMDPRPCKLADVTPVVPGVKYLMASVCQPAVFDALLAAGAEVVLWHTVSDNETADYTWLTQHGAPGIEEPLIVGGSTIGLTALQVGGYLGFRHFEVHGMDGSYKGEERHAGAHADPKKQKRDQTWDAEGKTYHTSKIMANAVAETINQMGLYPIFTVFHGEGLTQALLREADHPNCATARQVEKAAFVRRAVANFVEMEPKNRKALRAWSPWEAICFSNPDPNWVHELQMNAAIAEARRPLAKYNTGSISLETALLLRAVCAWRKPKVAVEIGTFIGNSTLALQAERIYTCDCDNDCLPPTKTIVPHPYTKSTDMLRKLLSRGVKADLFFFDGRLTDEDVMLVQQLATPRTVFAFDDFFEGKKGKGVANWVKLRAAFPQHGLVEPHQQYKGRSALALAVPVVPA